MTSSEGKDIVERLLARAIEADAAESALIEDVARELDPMSWLEGFFRGEQEMAIQKRNQQLARDKAITIIGIVRRSLPPPPTGDKDNG